MMDCSSQRQTDPWEELATLRTRLATLEQQQVAHTRLAEELQQCADLAALSSEVSVALVQQAPLSHSLQQCAEALVQHLDAAFARIWTLNTEAQVLELQASAGLYTHLDGAHSRVPVGQLKIGLIAAERRPHLTNAVIGDSRVSDQDWARHEGMVAFAGYPLLVEGQVVGVMALFARQQLDPAVLDAMASIANAVALSIARKQGEQQARVEAEAAQRRLSSILESIADAFFALDHQWRFTYLNAQSEPLLQRRRDELLGKNIWDEFPDMVGSSFYQQYHTALAQQVSVAFDAFYPPLDTWFDVRVYPSADGLSIYFRDIHERKRMEVERASLLELERQAHAEAEAALQLRNAFLSSISHDLKTPITAIKGAVQLLQRRVKRAHLPETVRLEEGLLLIESSTGKMTTMIDDLLDLAYLQSKQQLELNLSQVDLVALVRTIAAELQTTAPRHRLQVLASMPALIVPGDAVRLERVIVNLLSNAIKYSPQGGTITLTVSQEEHDTAPCCWAVLAVADQGLGIPAADLPHIFEPFQRASNVIGAFQGTGIGLTSASQIVSQHGGTMTATSQQGVGTTVTMALPL